jgi:ligand-binding sensor domain-containing protein
MKKYFLLTVVLLFSVLIFAQQNPQWMYFSNGSYITCIEEDTHSIWVGTSAGLVQIDKQTMQKTHYNKVTSDIPFNGITKIFFDNQQRMWLLGYSTDVQLAMWDGSDWTYFYIPEFGQNWELELTDIVQTPDSNIWVSDYEGLVFIGKNFQAINNRVEINASACQQIGRTHSLETDSIGNLYLGHGWEMSIRDISGNFSTVFPWGLGGGKIVVQERDPQGVLWIGSHHNGIVYPSVGGGDVARYVGNNWHMLVPPVGLYFSFVNDICFGTGGEIFIATAGYGVIKFHNNQFTFPTSNHPIVDTPWTTAVHLDQTGALWFGTLNGLYRMENNTIQYVNTSNSQLTSNVVKVYQKKDDTFLLQVRNKYFYFQPITFTTYIIHDGDTIAPSALNGFAEIDWKFEDNQGNLWGISRFSLHSLADTVLTTYTPDTAIYGYHLELFDICHDMVHQKIWIGTDEGLMSFVNNSFVFESDFMMNIYGPSVTAVFADSTGKLWAGSNGLGVAVYENGLWTSHNHTWALHNDYILKIVEDKNHALWFNTIYGRLGKYENNSWTIYNDQNSPFAGYAQVVPVFNAQNDLYIMDQYSGIKIMQNNVWDSIMINTSRLECSSSSLMFDNNGNLWITGNGITIYNPNGIVLGIDENAIPPSNRKGASVYPNPSDRGFYVEMSTPSQYPLQVMLHTTDGRRIFSRSVHQHTEVDTRNLSPGIYILTMVDAFGEVFVNRLVVGHSPVLTTP